MAMMHRRNALRALAGAVAALPALLAAKPVGAQAATAIEVLPGQIGVLASDGGSFADWPTEGEAAEMAEPRLLEIGGVQSVTLTLVGDDGPELVIVSDLTSGTSRLFIEDGD